VAVVLTVLLRRQEVRVTRHRLAEYGAAGWFSPAEVEMLATPAGRRQAKAWAKSQTPVRTVVMRKLITDATHLAFTRQRIATGLANEHTFADEQSLLDAVVVDRRVLLS
jgi:hypothetical protein